MTPSPIPKSRAGELFNEVADRIGSCAALDQFTLDRYKKEAKKLQSCGVDLPVAFTLNGVLAAYTFDLNSAHSYHRQAIAISRDEFTMSNYAVSLLMNGKGDEALAIATEVTKLWPEDLSLLAEAEKIAMQIGDVAAMRNLGEEYAKRTGDQSAITVHCEEIEKVFNSRGIDKSSYSKGLSVALAILAKNKVRPRDTIVDIDNLMSGDETILHSILVSQSMESVLAMQDELAVALADELGDQWMPEALMFEYRMKE